MEDKELNFIDFQEAMYLVLNEAQVSALGCDQDESVKVLNAVDQVECWVEKNHITLSDSFDRQFNT